MFGQAPLGDHVAGDFGRALDVVRRAGRDRLGSEDDFLGDAAAEQRADAALQATLAGAVAIRFRQEHRHAQRAAARDDGDLINRVVLGHRQADDGVTGLVIRGELLLLLVHDHGAALGAHHDLVLGALELVHRHRATVRTSREQRSFVDQVGEVGTGEARRTRAITFGFTSSASGSLRM